MGKVGAEQGGPCRPCNANKRTALLRPTGKYSKEEGYVGADAAISSIAHSHLTISQEIFSQVSNGENTTGRKQRCVTCLTV